MEECSVCFEFLPEEDLDEGVCGFCLNDNALIDEWEEAEFERGFNDAHAESEMRGF